jgi:threonine dehydratase
MAPPSSWWAMKHFASAGLVDEFMTVDTDAVCAIRILLVGTAASSGAGALAVAAIQAMSRNLAQGQRR